MELLKLNVMTKMNVYPTMNLLKILKKVTPVLVIMVTAVTNATMNEECELSTHNCDINARCSKINGLFTCSCNLGFIGDSVTCYDVDEREKSPFDKNATYNSVGS